MGRLAAGSFIALCTLSWHAESKASIYRKPPMGWMSWEHQGCQRDCVADPDGCISANLYQGVADVLVSDGYAAKGYTWIDVDDCFLAKRDPATNELQADEARFPGGIAALAKYVHSKGLHLGIYNDIGPGTCAGDPGLNVSAVPDVRADAQLKKDVQTFASWDIDSLKVDGCGGDKDMMHVTYPKLGAALNATGRQIWYSCSWPVYESLGKPDCNSTFGYRCLPWKELTDSCNSWRIDKDIMDAFYLPGHSGVRNIIEHMGEANATLSQWQRPGAFNDPDMILIGNNGLSVAESKIQFGMWSMFSAPLLMSNDLKSLSDELKDILQNEEVIAVDQDSEGLFPESIILSTHVQLAPSTVQLWHKKLHDGSTAVALVNFGVFDGQHYNATFTSEMVGLAPGTAFKARDLFARVDLGAHATGTFQAMLEATSILMLKLTPV